MNDPPAPTYTLERFEEHWEELARQFTADHTDARGAFAEIIVLISRLGAEIQSRGRLAENCSYLLLAKALNHSLAAYSLLQHGLLIDAALSARNGLETTLMLELFAKDRSVDHFEAWSNGKRYAPRDVRAKLKTLTSVTIGEVSISSDVQTYDDFHVAYEWLCEITHANLKSSNHTVRWSDAGDLTVAVGGSLDGQSHFVRAIFKILCHSLLQAIVMCAAAFTPEFLKREASGLNSIARQLENASQVSADA